MTKKQIAEWIRIYQKQYPVIDKLSYDGFLKVTETEQGTKAIFDFNRVVRNYLKMQRLCQQ